MTIATIWSDAIGYVTDDEGGPSLETVVEHIRTSVIENGFTSRGRITSGLKEAYRPLGIDDAIVRKKTDAAIRALLLSGDIEEFSTAAGRGYASTPPRQIHWGGSHTALLGSSTFGSGLVRHLPLGERPDDNAVSVSLQEELGRPEWRDALVELGSADAPTSDARELNAFTRALAASGERYSLDEPEAVAVVSGRGDFFGRMDPTPSGRWRRPDGDGTHAAVIRTGYITRNVVLHVEGKDATLWEAPTRDVWCWIVVGQTLSQNDPVLRYDARSGSLDFLIPPPRQAERAALIAGTRTGLWSWKVDGEAHAIIAGLMGSPR